MNFFENITFRRKHVISDSNTNCEILNETLDESASSIPDISMECNDEAILKLKEQINKLELELNSAHQEIKTLSKENKNLKKLNEDLLKENDLYKRNTNSAVKSKETKIRSPIKEEPSKSNKIQIDALKQSAVATNTKSDSSDSKPQIGKPRHSHITRKIVNLKKRKLRIISNCKYHGALENIENIFSEHFEYCHYLSSRSGLKEILINISEKVKNLSLDDYCIIMIGENDIKSARVCNIELIKQLRESLQQITHTNVVVCCPTYVRGALIQNYRTKMFNNLLYLDIHNNNYAYIFDTNRDLSLEMFSHRTGKLNSHGTKRIFESIYERMIIDIKNYPLEDLNNTSNNSDFFRL